MSYNQYHDSAYLKKHGYKKAANLVTTDELHQQVIALRQLIDNGMVDAKDLDFCTSLCQQHKQKGGLSEKQAMWVGKMLQRAMGIEEQTQYAPPSIKNPKGSGPTIGIRKLINLFKQAGTKLKKPRIVLQMDSGRLVKVYPSKYGDAINVVLQNPYQKFGWIKSEDNILRFNKPAYGESVDAHTRELVIDLLEKLAADPAAVTAANGKAMGSCCYCKLPLSDPKSLDKGYGPVCAKNWGLPWGD